MGINVYIRQYCIRKFTIAFILKNKEAINVAAMAMDVKKKLKQSMTVKKNVLLPKKIHLNFRNIKVLMRSERST